MSVDARHAVTMGLLGTLLSRERVESIEFQYKHGTPVDCPRNELFAEAIRDKVDTLVWMDSDCYIEPTDIELAVELIMASYAHDWTFTTVATPQRDGIVNIWSGLDHTATLANHKYSVEDIADKRTCPPHSEVPGCRFPILASGLGFAVFSMRQYRKHWAKGPWFVSRHAQLADGTPYFQSEDFFHTSQLSTMIPGAKPHCDPRFIVGHVHRGGSDD